MKFILTTDFIQFQQSTEYTKVLLSLDATFVAMVEEEEKPVKPTETCPWYYCDLSQMIWSRHDKPSGMREDNLKAKPYCPVCGKKIEIK